MIQEKIAMGWLDNKEHLKDMMCEMSKSNELTDVTLFSDDNKQFKAHKIVLISCSSVFKNIFDELPQYNSVVHLTGVQHQEIKSILELMYLGSTTFHAERKNDLLSVAKNLEMKGVTCEDDYKENIVNNIQDILNNDYKDYPEEKINNLNAKNDDMEELFDCDQCDSQFEGKGNLENHILTYHDNQTCYVPQYKHTCNQCQYETQQRSLLKRHIQSMHEGLRYNCNQCNYTGKSKDVLKIHNKSKHLGIKYPCIQCQYIARQKNSLKKHIQSKHEGVRYDCNQCNYQTTQQGILTNHIKSKHLGIKYCCNLCQYEATEKRILKRHMQSTHEGVANVNI